MNCNCKIVMRNGGILDTSMGNTPCSEVSRIELCECHAAAPDLLAALENATNVLAGLAVGDLKTIYHNSPALAQARAAIAKARGQS